ncbi:MAG TPA: hypothetical protein DDZ96_08355 [Porphyromonadaceae bacterium]|jgi:hypothetical protein|uniref:hypothetical protein n=1 Tax=Limibacterium fermenti TaxID=3229863 RepID=UPI000E9ACC08|nr:hypothetical protein [Porphyromonadaceae bacterium]HBL33816.1 hypothetical protein [Porphyromonadaceae bacterium]HBX20039.1 hypothetical protein [Porphyromonadaceae bacterium]HBX44875.1 hypothetical protein [Porphyromonadaceae bacterium]HCM22407.1 hypothetical protein [Porphyromonadaceae bacterium]
MDIQSRKLNFIQEFLQVQNEELMSRLEKVLYDYRSHPEPLTVEEFNKRIEQSLEDSENDRVIEAGQLLSEINQWK